MVTLKGPHSRAQMLLCARMTVRYTFAFVKAKLNGIIQLPNRLRSVLCRVIGADRASLSDAL